LIVSPIAALDHVCCGNGGRIETLLEAGRRTGDRRFLDRARDLGLRVIDRAKAQGGYRLGNPNRFRAVSFHQGLAGIGYQWLRLYRPDEIPSVLLWA
jgi:lantibiotic modifying enzyme